jgi:hypothetical protein
MDKDIFLVVELFIINLGIYHDYESLLQWRALNKFKKKTSHKLVTCRFTLHLPNYFFLKNKYYFNIFFNKKIFFQVNIVLDITIIIVMAYTLRKIIALACEIIML